LGTAQVPKKAKAAEPLRSSRASVSGRSIVVRLHGGKQTGLGGFGGTAGVVGIVALAGDAFAVQGGVLKQVESLRRESEFVLRDRTDLRETGYASGVCFVSLRVLLRLICRVKSRILLARVNPAAGAKLSAWVLPNLTPPVPMKTKLRQFRRHIARLLICKLNPNPFADNLAQLPKARSLMVEHVQNFRCRKPAIVKPLPEINLRQLF
jgi:hypothetical protein